MSALRMIAWGVIDFDTADGPTRDRLLKEVQRELKPYDMFMQRHWNPYLGVAWELRSRHHVIPSEFVKYGMHPRRRTGRMRSLAIHALRVIEPSNDQTTEASDAAR